MKPKTDVSENLKKKIPTEQIIITSLSITFLLFVWNIYSSWYENNATLFSINMALIKAITVGIAVFIANVLYYRKKKIADDNKTETGESIKTYSLIISIFALLGLFCLMLLCIFNHWRLANAILWFGGGFYLMVIVIVLILKKKKES
jgi:uncharacterized membrane-anchored protein